MVCRRVVGAKMKVKVKVAGRVDVKAKMLERYD